MILLWKKINQTFNCRWGFNTEYHVESVSAAAVRTRVRYLHSSPDSSWRSVKDKYIQYVWPTSQMQSSLPPSWLPGTAGRSPGRPWLHWSSPSEAPTEPPYWCGTAECDKEDWWRSSMKVTMWTSYWSEFTQKWYYKCMHIFFIKSYIV